MGMGMGMGMDMGMGMGPQRGQFGAMGAAPMSMTPTMGILSQPEPRWLGPVPGVPGQSLAGKPQANMTGPSFVPGRVPGSMPAPAYASSSSSSYGAVGEPHHGQGTKGSMPSAGKEQPVDHGQIIAQVAELAGVLADETTAKRNKSRTTGTRGLPPHANDLLRNWLFHKDNILRPYPTPAQKIDLAKRASISRKQVDTWFVNARKRLWTPTIRQLLLTGEVPPGAQKAFCAAAGVPPEELQKAGVSVSGAFPSLMRPAMGAPVQRPRARSSSSAGTGPSTAQQ